MEKVLFCGPPSKAKSRRRLFWERVHTGDPRKKGIIEHICPGPSCCKSRRELEAKVCGLFGVLALLRPPPKRWPRKSWSGQAEVGGHILQCELAGGLISAHLPLVAKHAAARAKKAMERTRVCSEEMEDKCREDVANERARALWAETQAEQERSGCARALAFLSVLDAIPRLISLMVVLERYRVLKSRILTRNGQQWALAAMAAVVPVAASDGSVPSPAAPLAASSAEPQKMIIKEALPGG